MNAFLLTVTTHVIVAIVSGVFVYLNRKKIERALNG